jgi:glutamate--cysteine ligase
MARQVTEDATPIEAIGQLTDYFLEGAKPRSDWGHGIEFEWIGVFTESGETVPFEGERSIVSVLQGLSQRHGWTAVHEGEHLVALQRRTSAVSLEPGAQLEFAGSVHNHLTSLQEELRGFREEVDDVSNSLGISWLAIGLNPFTPVERIGWIPKARYRIMSRRLGKRGKLAHHMMKGTAGFQGNFDFGSEANAIRKFRLAMGVTSVSTALLANSPIYLGVPNRFLSMRAFIWLDTDPDRCGLLELAFHPESGFRSYIDYALSVPLLFIVRDGRWIDMEGFTFRRFMAEGRGEWRATVSDWTRHLTTLFPEARLKRYLEVRGADSVGSGLALALMAWWKGLLYSERALDDAWRMVADLTWPERQQLHRDVCANGPDATVRGRPMREMARELTEISRQGLAEQRDAGHALDEIAFLDPIQELLEDTEGAPARRLLDRWEGEWKRDRSLLVRFCSDRSFRSSQGALAQGAGRTTTQLNESLHEGSLPAPSTGIRRCGLRRAGHTTRMAGRQCGFVDKVMT